MHWRTTATVLLLSTTGCVKEISSEERLERATQPVNATETATAAELGKINCGDIDESLAKARNENRPENERVSGYADLYKSLSDRVRTFEQAMARNPDLHYREESRPLVAAKEVCIQQRADVGVEFERYVRELVAVPTVQEVKGGSTATVARLDYDILRQAIETLDPEDKEALLSRVAAAEKKVETRKPAPSGARRRGR